MSISYKLQVTTLTPFNLASCLLAIPRDIKTTVEKTRHIEPSMFDCIVYTTDGVVSSRFISHAMRNSQVSRFRETTITLIKAVTALARVGLQHFGGYRSFDRRRAAAYQAPFGLATRRNGVDQINGNP